MRARSDASCARVCDSAPTPPDDRDERIGRPVTEKEGKTNNVAFHRQPRPERDTFFTTGSVLFCILQFYVRPFPFCLPQPLAHSFSRSVPLCLSVPPVFLVAHFCFRRWSPKRKIPNSRWFFARRHHQSGSSIVNVARANYS